MTNRNELAEKIIKHKQGIVLLKERMDRGKAELVEMEKELITILDGTGETVCFENYEITCNSPKGSVEITKDTPKEYCIVKEVLTPDKKLIKKELDEGKKLDFATIVFNVKLNIKEVKNV